MSSAVVKIGQEIAWESPDGQRRQMGVLFERDITPTQNISVGTVLIPPGCEQSKLSHHEGKEEVYYIVKGQARFMLDDEAHEVDEGTAIYVGSGVGHRAINTGQGDLILLWFNSPPVFEKEGDYREFTKSWKPVR